MEAFYTPLTSALDKQAWRQDAMKIVEELLVIAGPSYSDMLLDLRQSLRGGQDWAMTLDLFLASRRELEAEYYLPFYRLRRLLTHWLKLEISGEESSEGSCLRCMLRLKYRSLEEIRSVFQRQTFEYQVDCPELKVVECVS